MVLYYLQKVTGKSDWKVNGTILFESFQWEISGAKECLKKVVMFSRSERSRREFIFHFFKANFDTSFAYALAAVFR